MKRVILLLFIIPALVQCTTTRTNKTMTSYEYVDGNGNLYAISNSSIVYDPVTPEESSTGMYSGGEAYTAPLEQKQFDQIEATFKKVIEHKEDISETRSMGTGTLIVLPSKKTYIFKMNSSSKKEIDEVIRLMTKK